MGIRKIILAIFAVIAGIGIISFSFYQDDVNTEPQIEISKIPESEPDITKFEPITTETEIIEEIPVTEPVKTYPKEVQCTGSARCISDFVTRIIDGDTIVVGDKSIRFALINTPEFGDSDYTQARNFIEHICPVGSKVLVDEDDGQTQGSYGRIIGKIYCNNLNLNEEVLEVGHAVILPQFCEVSEFAQEPWAKKHGC